MVSTTASVERTATYSSFSRGLSRVPHFCLPQTEVPVERHTPVDGNKPGVSLPSSTATPGPYGLSLFPSSPFCDLLLSPSFAKIFQLGCVNSSDSPPFLPASATVLAERALSRASMSLTAPAGPRLLLQAAHDSPHFRPNFHSVPHGLLTP